MVLLRVIILSSHPATSSQVAKGYTHTPTLFITQNLIKRFAEFGMVTSRNLTLFVGYPLP